MSAIVTDYYCDEKVEVVEKYTYPSSENWTIREANWVNSSNKVIYSVVSTGMVLKIWWQDDQYTFRKIDGLPKNIQMALLIGAI